MLSTDFPVAFDDCAHGPKDRDHEPSDPSVGIFGEYWLCNACGAHADAADVETDEDGSNWLIIDWKEPDFDDA